MDLTRDELKKLLATIITCAGDYSWSENINRDFVHDIAERNGLEFKPLSDDYWDTEKICVEKENG